MSFQLRCAHCSGSFHEPAYRPMQLAGLVKAGVGPRVPSLPDEVRRRCRGCGFVNIFIPMDEEFVQTL